MQLAYLPVIYDCGFRISRDGEANPMVNKAKTKWTEKTVSKLYDDRWLELELIQMAWRLLCTFSPINTPHHKIDY